MALKKIKKLYYSIGDVSEITDLKQYVLRYWETEFSHIKHSKNRAGNRIYKESDYNNIKELKNLLHNRKFTIKGAKQYLKDRDTNASASTVNQDPSALKLIDTLDIKTLKNIQKPIIPLMQVKNVTVCLRDKTR